MREVSIVQELLTHYRVPFYERLKSLLADQGVDLRLLHGKASGDRAKRVDEASISWAEVSPIANLPVPGRPAGLVWQPVAEQVRESDLVIVEHANRQLFTQLALARSALGFKPLTALWGHGGNLQAANSNSMAERFKRATARLPHWWFAYTQGSADRVKAAGFPGERITVVQNAISVRRYPEDGAQKNPFHCAYVGSLHHHKRIDFLIAAGAEIASREPRFKLSIIGAGENHGVVERAAIDHPSWLKYWGPLFGSEKSAVLNDAVLTLNPGLIGLGVLDSFAAEAPVVTTAIPTHSPEFEYVTHGENGLVLPVQSSPSDYASAVLSTLHDPESLRRMRSGCRRASSELTIEAMAQRYLQGVLAALRTPARRRSLARRG